MQIVHTGPAGYRLRCACNTTFQGGRLRLTFECPRCGRAADAAELITEWTLSGSTAAERSLQP